MGYTSLVTSEMASRVFRRDVLPLGERGAPTWTDSRLLCVHPAGAGEEQCMEGRGVESERCIPCCKQMAYLFTFVVIILKSQH